jgi:hypothetical protein
MLIMCMRMCIFMSPYSVKCFSEIGIRFDHVRGKRNSGKPGVQFLLVSVTVRVVVTLEATVNVPHDNGLPTLASHVTTMRSPASYLAKPSCTSE